MKFRHRVLQGLPVVMLVCNLLPAPAQSEFTQQGPKLVAPGTSGDTGQGWSVSVSGDGNTAVVGGPFYNNFAGAAWVFTRSRGVWTQQAKLVGTGAMGEQGYSVALSADGGTAILGAPFDDFAGAAWVFTRSRGVWTQQAKLVGTGAIGNAAQGYSVALSADGNTAILGGVDDNSLVGAAWVFSRSRGVWTQQAKLVGTGAIGSSEQGISVSLSGDGSTAILGGPGDDSTGAAWVFTGSRGVWTQQAKLVGTGIIGSEESASQGYSVSVSGDGNTTILGGLGDNTSAGAAWVFTRSREVWTQQAKLVGTGAVFVAMQGASVSLSGDGNTAIVGGPDDSGGVGAAWVFTRSRRVWRQQGSKLVGTGAVGPLGAQQGLSVSLSGNGNTAIVGGPFDDFEGENVGQVGAAWVFAQRVFAGTPGKANCFGQSVSALAGQYNGLNAAVAALAYSSVGALQDAIMGFCGG